MAQRPGDGRKRHDRCAEEKSSAASSEAHIASEQVSMESNWGPWPPAEPGNRDTMPAQPYRPQKANQSDGPRLEGLWEVLSTLRIKNGSC